MYIEKEEHNSITDYKVLWVGLCGNEHNNSCNGICLQTTQAFCMEKNYINLIWIKYMFSEDIPHKNLLMDNVFHHFRKFLKVKNQRCVITHNLEQADGNLRFQNFLVENDPIFVKLHVTTNPTLNAFEENLFMNDDDEVVVAEPDSTIDD